MVPAHPHGELQELFPNIFFVTGTVPMPGPLPVRFSRNMTVLRSGASLTLVNSIRLDEAGLAALERLGKVEHVIRLAGFHGMDDPFYKQRYGARVYAPAGQLYHRGFKADPSKVYFQADVELRADTPLPHPGSRLYLFPCSPPEGLLLLEAQGGVLISGDCLQNWQAPDRYFSALGKLMMKAMGFIKPYNIGPGWLRAARPHPRDIHEILNLPFQHVLPAHGTPVLGDAKQRYRPAIEAIR